MKKLLPKLAFTTVLFCYAISSNAQTAGTLTFSFTPVTKSPCYSGTKNYLAVWIQDNTGKFIKTKYVTNKGIMETDHLPTWAKVSSNGINTNCTSALCNVFDATTGATLSSFTKKTIVWDGKNVSGTTANGTTVADGVITIKIEECWNHGSTGMAIKTYTFTKGPNTDHQTPPNDANFTNVILDWMPSSTSGIEDNTETNSGISIYPNPTTKIFNVSFIEATHIKVVNTLGIVVYDEKIDQTGAGSRSIDLSNFANGIYVINVLNGNAFSNLKVILNK